jgi:predicted porin
MKTKWKVVAPALLLSSVAGMVHAQSSVTLYGVIDEGINYTNNAHTAAGTKGSQLALADNQVYGSRFGLKGSEDLGGGYKAIFQLENGFHPSSGNLGQGGRLFGRQAYVGLSSNRFGTLTLGRQYDPTVDMFSDLTASGGWEGNFGAAPFDNDNADWDFRVDNSVKYVTPTYNGLSGEFMYGFSNTAGGLADNRLYSAAAQYRNGGLTAAVAYMKIDNPGLGSNGAVSANETVFTGSSQQDIDAGVNYKLANVLVGLTYSHTSIDSPTANSYLTLPIAPANGGTWTSWKFDNFGINGQYFFQPNLWLGAAYTYTLGNLDTTLGNYSPKWHTASLMLDYDLSHRTSLYMQCAYQHVASAGTGTQFDNAQVFVGSADPSTSANQLVYRVGMVHKF